MRRNRGSRATAELIRSLLADSANDLLEVQFVRETLRQWDRGCFRAQQAAEKALRALRIGLGDGHDLPLSYIADHIRAVEARRPELAILLTEGLDLDRFFLRTGLPLGVPQIHGETELLTAEKSAIRIRRAATEALGTLGFSISSGDDQL